MSSFMNRAHSAGREACSEAMSGITTIEARATMSQGQERSA